MLGLDFVLLSLEYQIYASVYLSDIVEFEPLTFTAEYFDVVL